AALHDARHGAAPAARSDAGGLPRPLQPPAGLALLPFMDEVPPAPARPPGRARRALHVPLLAVRDGDARTARAARGRRPRPALLRRPALAAPALGDRSRRAAGRLLPPPA